MPVLTAIGKLLLDKTIEFLLPKAWEMIERGAKNAEVAAAKKLIKELASGQLAQTALVLVARCELNPEHGASAEQATFVVDVFNVSPVVLQVDECCVKLSGWGGNPRTEIFRSKRKRGKRNEPVTLNPGSHVTIEFMCPVTMCGALPADGAAILVQAEFAVELQGPAPQLCCTVERGAACWMPWRGT
jgi:hypothetical protein